MIYELSFFDEFIQQYLPSSQAGVSEEEFEEKKKLLREEGAGVRSRMIIHVFTFKRQSGIEIYIQHHQSALIALSDSLLHYMDGQCIRSIYKLSRTNHFNNLCKLCYQALEEILFWIETYFSQYFNRDGKLPEVHKLIAIRELEEKTGILDHSLVAAGVNAELIRIALLPLRKFSENHPPRTKSYRKLIWLKELVRELQQLGERGQGHGDKDKTEEDIFSILCYLNLNSVSFYNYYTAQFRKEIENEGTIAEQLEKINWLKRNISQLQEKPGFALSKKVVSAKEMLLQWLSEEQKYIGSKQELNPKQTDQPGQKEMPINMNISVAQLGCLLRWLVDTEIFTIQSHTDLIKFFAANFTTFKRGKISPGSLRIKYYDIDMGTANAVRDLLFKLLHYSKKT
ncbi:MAG: hypothetical protein EOO01_11605 [Chitinophagaceae bacterium]|nr:MAG: hypothetical protein EOO01_11605 [Chitinophagaceae bacterium]